MVFIFFHMIVWSLFVVSDKEIGEVCIHDLGLFLFHFDIRVVGWEYQVDLSAKWIDADNPIETSVHLLLQAVRVLHELHVHLTQYQLQIRIEHLLSRQVAQLNRQIHPWKVKEPQGVFLLWLLWLGYNLVQKLR